MCTTFNKKIFLPKIHSVEYFNKNKLRLCIDNLKCGLAVTIGSSLRRVLLSFIPGYVITKVKIDGVYHEYSIKDGVFEDVIDVLLNLKEVVFFNETKQEEIELLLSKTGGTVYASDFSLPQFVVISNPKKILAHLEDSCTLNIAVVVSKGFGYTPIFTTSLSNDESRYSSKLKGNWLYLDSFYSPVKRINYYVSTYNKNSGFENLTLEIEVYAGKDPIDYVKYAAQFLMEYFSFFANFDFTVFQKQVININLNPILWDKIEVLNLSSRAYNCLISENIVFLGDLVQKFENDLLKIPYLGSKLLFEIKGTLLLKNLTLGMFIKNWDQFKKINNKNNIVGELYASSK